MNNLKYSNTVLINLIIVLFTTLLNLNFFYLLNNVLVIFFSGLFIIYYKKNYIFENKIFVSLGKISYSFYLWHLPVIFFFDLYINNKIIFIFSSFFLSLLLSNLSYKYIEKPFINIKNIKTWNWYSNKFPCLPGLNYLLRCSYDKNDDVFSPKNMKTS